MHKSPRGHVSVSAELHARLAAYCERTGVSMSSVVEGCVEMMPAARSPLDLGDVPRVAIEVSDDLFDRAVRVARRRRGLNRVPAVDLIDRAILRAIDDWERHPDHRKFRTSPRVSHAAVRR